MAQDVYIVGAARFPIGKFGGSLARLDVDLDDGALHWCHDGVARRSGRGAATATLLGLRARRRPRQWRRQAKCPCRRK